MRHSTSRSIRHSIRRSTIQRFATSRLARLALAALVALAPAAAQADVTSIDLDAPGDGLVTRDNGAQRDWLDLTQTTGLTRAQAAALTQAGARYAGWRVASVGQVGDLYRNAVGPFTFSTNGNTFIDTTPATADRLTAFMRMLGVTYAFPGQIGAFGLVDGRPAITGPDYQAAVLLVYSDTANSGFAWFNEQYTSPSYSSGDTGVFLTRSLSAGAVPEPATWLMMILGFGLVGAGLRRRGAVRPAVIS
jgi:hypothetical protein